LRLVDDQPEEQPQAAAIARSVAQLEARAIARSAAQRLADHTGGQLEEGEGGLRTVHFPAPGLTQQPFTISREFTDQPAASQAAGSTPHDPGGPAPKAPSPEEEKQKREELYDYFLERFKRDLLAEREQMGYLIIDNP
jgi:hypothetical protein